MVSTIERLGAATHCYIGRCKCGAVVATRVDRGGKDTARDVAVFIRDGLVVERVPRNEVTLEACRCEPEQTTRTERR